MLNAIWVAMLLVAVVVGAATGKLDAVAKASVDSAGAAVTLALGLVGVMAFWLGLMRVLQEGGALAALARAMRPLMTRLFPDVPADHPAMSMMIMNMASNILGLGNAATPFGLKAMLELDELNQHKGTATNAMVLFLAINTSGLAVFPTGMIALRASLGSTAPGAIFATTVLATMLSTLTAVVLAKALQGRRLFAVPSAAATPAGVLKATAASIDVSEAQKLAAAGGESATRRTRLVGWSLTAVVAAALVYALHAKATTVTDGVPLGWSVALKGAISDWPLVLLIVGFVLFGITRGVKIYDAIVEGAKEGFNVALRIIPFLVAILVAIGMLRASGAIDMLVTVVGPWSARVGVPAEALPMAFLRPLSGSGAYAVAAELMKVHGPDSMVGNIVATMQGSTETTFYVLALYFGVVGIKNSRHALVAGLGADVIGMLVASWLCLALLG